MNIDEIIKEIHTTYPETCSMLEYLTDEEYKLFCKKQFDYGISNITVGRFIGYYF